MIGREEVWLPGRWRNLRFDGDKRERFIARLIKMIRWLERWSHSAWFCFRSVFSSPTSRIVTVGVAVGAIGIALILFAGAGSRKLLENVTTKGADMSTGESNTTRDASSEPSARRAEKLLSTLAERLGAQITAASVFGAAVERDGVTVIPVAVVRFGFGGGAGADPAKAQDGAGAGGGGIVGASGYIEIKNGRSRFVPVVHPDRRLALISAVIVAGLLIARPTTRTRRTVLPWR